MKAFGWILLCFFAVYAAFAASFAIVYWDIHAIDPRTWGWMDFRIGIVLVLATATHL